MSGTQKAWTVLTIVLARLRFVAIFVVAGLIVGYWDHIKNHVDKWTRPASHFVAAGEQDEYYCPMHPQVVRSQAGVCPICNMDLKKREPGERAAAVTDRVQLSPYRMALANVATTPVAYRPLV